ncbi:MAG: hypothetical protein KGY66_03820 [Candidatus Thermoplasmatota archaeon]|nr:hypothetical protein [Candidatus Thermoplasmatota archaeon]MBS3790025.1 hypothetical protein [Candidatus Thermoplasmatota archaeon]
MVEESDVGLLERTKSFFRSKNITPSDKADEFITKTLPDYIEEYRLATRKDLKGVDKKIESFVEEVSDLKEWREETKERVHEDLQRIERLEKKLGMEEEK